MSTDTGIQWTDATWNPVRGCSRVSPGCEHCYAETMASRFSAPGRPFHGFAADGKWTRRVELVPEALEQPLRWRRPRRIFVNSMSDLFHESLPDRDIFRVLDICAQAALVPGHTMQILTKRAERMHGLVREYLDHGGLCGAGAFCQSMHGEGAHPVLPDRIWLSVSCEDQPRADERIPWLLRTPAAVRGVSLEPLLCPVDLRAIHPVGAKTDTVFDVLHGEGSYTSDYGVRGISVDDVPRLDWVIVGGESGPGARECRVEWIRDIVQQCRAANVPCFVKQDYGRLPGQQGRIPDDLWIKELPYATRSDQGARTSTPIP